MSIKQFVIAYVSSAVAFLAMDSVWLTLMAERLYRPSIGHLMLDKFQYGPAVLFYAIYVIGVVVLAVSPALDKGQWSSALLLGGLLGLVAYGAYDMTNQATLRGWPWRLTLIDLCWGTVVTGVASTVGYAVTRWVDR